MRRAFLSFSILLLLLSHSTFAVDCKTMTKFIQGKVGKIEPYFGDAIILSEKIKDDREEYTIKVTPSIKDYYPPETAVYYGVVSKRENRFTKILISYPTIDRKKADDKMKSLRDMVNILPNADISKYENTKEETFESFDLQENDKGECTIEEVKTSYYDAKNKKTAMKLTYSKKICDELRPHYIEMLKTCQGAVEKMNSVIEKYRTEYAKKGIALEKNSSVDYYLNSNPLFNGHSPLSWLANCSENSLNFLSNQPGSSFGPWGSPAEQPKSSTSSKQRPQVTK